MKDIFGQGIAVGDVAIVPWEGHLEIAFCVFVDSNILTFKQFTHDDKVSSGTVTIMEPETTVAVFPRFMLNSDQMISLITYLKNVKSNA